MVIDANTPPPLVDAPPASAIPQEKLPFSGQWTDAEALTVVLNDFQRAESYRTQNHDPRWQDADETYLAYSRRSNYWEGTNKPRSNLQIFTAYEQVESLIPQVLDALFGADLDFDVQPAKSGTTVTQALNVRDLIQYEMASLGGERTKFVTLRENTRRQIKSAFIYGNGILEWGWEGPYLKDKTIWARTQVPEMQAVEHPMMPGVAFHAPTGRTQSFVHPVQQKEVVSHFFLKWIDIRDFYIDPNCPSANVQEAGFVCHRQLMTIDEIRSYRGISGWNVPDDEELLRLSKEKQVVQGDTTKMVMESDRGVNWQPNLDNSKDPTLARLEVIRYWQKGRHVWMLNRKITMRNQSNQYGALPFVNETYTDVLGRFYGLSICDIVRGDQKLEKALIDGRLDELNLILHPPTITKRGMMRSTSQMKLSPGRNWEADEPLKDVVRLEMGNVTQSAFTEVDSLERRVQKKTGVTDLAVLGVSSSGGNSANRTATGVQAQTNASNSRVHYIVANHEDQVMMTVVPMCFALIQNFLDPQQIVQIIGPAGQQMQFDPVDILNADVNFKFNAATKMKARAGLQGGGLNTFMQFVLNPEVMKLNAQQQGTVVDMGQVDAMFCDTFNLRATSFWRPMNPQEQQAMQQQNMQSIQEKMAVQGARLQQMSADAHERDETQLMVALIQALGAAGMLNKVVGLPMPIELEAKRLDAEIAGGQYEAPPTQ